MLQASGESEPSACWLESAVRDSRDTLGPMKDDLDRRWRDLGEFIREQRNVGQMSLRKLSEVAGVSNPYLSQIERGLRRPSAEILQQIARALEISSETLYVRAGILDEPAEQVDPIAEIRRDPSITEDQKKSLVRIYQSFRRENEIDALEALESLDDPALEALDDPALVGAVAGSGTAADALDAAEDEGVADASGAVSVDQIDDTEPADPSADVAV